MGAGRVLCDDVLRRRMRTCVLSVSSTVGRSVGRSVDPGTTKVPRQKCGVTEHPRGAIFYCFRGNSMGYHGNMKILLPWGVPIHRFF